MFAYQNWYPFCKRGDGRMDGRMDIGAMNVNESNVGEGFGRRKLTSRQGWFKWNRTMTGILMRKSRRRGDQSEQNPNLWLSRTSPLRSLVLYYDFFMFYVLCSVFCVVCSVFTKVIRIQLDGFLSPAHSISWFVFCILHCVLCCVFLWFSFCVLSCIFCVCQSDQNPTWWLSLTSPSAPLGSEIK